MSDHHYRISEANGTTVGHLVIDERGQGHMALVPGYTREPAKPLYVTEELPPKDGGEA